MLFDETIARIRDISRRPGPAIASVEGRLGLSPLDLVLEATKGRRRVLFVPPALTDAENRRALAASLAPLAGDVVPATGSSVRATASAKSPAGLGGGAGVGGRGRGSGVGWTALLGLLADLAPLAVIVDEPEGIAAVHRGFWRNLAQAWREVARRGARVHLFLCSRERGLGSFLNRSASPLADMADPVAVVRLEPGTHYDLARAVPRWTGRDLLLGWAVFGGQPATWAEIPGRVDPTEALRRALANTARPWRSDRWTRGPEELLRSGVRKTNRYASILSRLARDTPGRRLRNASTTGPYLARLQELGIVAADRPLGARPGGRRTRYRLSDPHEAFWWSTVHPVRAQLRMLGSGGAAGNAAGAGSANAPDGPASRNPALDALWDEAVAPALNSALVRAFPMICRNFLRFGSGQVLGATAREVGALWGPGFDFPAAAALHNGAVCYGHLHHGPERASLATLAELERHVRKTRYGFARQARVRIVFSLAGFDEDLRREAARNALIRLVGTDELAAAPGFGGAPVR